MLANRTWVVDIQAFPSHPFDTHNSMTFFITTSWGTEGAGAVNNAARSTGVQWSVSDKSGHAITPWKGHPHSSFKLCGVHFHGTKICISFELSEC